ncbi:hypothetical protein [Caudoviricetes sp.]|nr:hypothetical protein [Caudoviricetes sp.]
MLRYAGEPQRQGFTEASSIILTSETCPSAALATSTRASAHSPSTSPAGSADVAWAIAVVSGKHTVLGRLLIASRNRSSSVRFRRRAASTPAMRTLAESCACCAWRWCLIVCSCEISKALMWSAWCWAVAVMWSRSIWAILPE